jgi:hypothetical protein
LLVNMNTETEVDTSCCVWQLLAFFNQDRLPNIGLQVWLITSRHTEPDLNKKDELTMNIVGEQSDFL